MVYEAVGQRNRAESRRCCGASTVCVKTETRSRSCPCPCPSHTVAKRSPRPDQVSRHRGRSEPKTNLRSPRSSETCYSAPVALRAAMRVRCPLASRKATAGGWAPKGSIEAATVWEERAPVPSRGRAFLFLRKESRGGPVKRPGRAPSAFGAMRARPSGRRGFLAKRAQKGVRPSGRCVAPSLGKPHYPAATCHGAARQRLSHRP